MGVRTALGTTTRLSAAAAGIALAAGCSTVAAATETDLESAYEACTTSSRPGASGYAKRLEIVDEGHTVIIESTAGNDLLGYITYACIAVELDTPMRLTNRIEATTSRMGRRSSTEGEFTYEYSYHPDHGLYVLITDVE